MPMYRNRFEVYIDSDIEIKPSELKRLVELGAASLEKDDVFHNQIQKVSVRKTVQGESNYTNHSSNHEIASCNFDLDFDIEAFKRNHYCFVYNENQESLILNSLQINGFRWVSFGPATSIKPSKLSVAFKHFPYKLYLTYNDMIHWDNSDPESIAIDPLFNVTHMFENNELLIVSKKQELVVLLGLEKQGVKWISGSQPTKITQNIPYTLVLQDGCLRYH